jgi:hypothetical protein
MGAMSEQDGGATRVDAPPAASASDRALARHAERLRPLRIIYAAVLAVVVITAVVVVKIAYVRGEISHVTLRTVPSGLPTIAAGTPSASLTRAWTSSDTTAIGAPVYGGTVITHDGHTVRGRNARTGAQTWSYTRTDRSVCTAIQTQSVTIAVYKLHGDCDELTGLDSATGARKWTRTLDKDGAEFDGPATYSVVGGNVLFVSRTSIYSIAPGGDADHGNGGLDYWTFHHTGCTIDGAVLGTAGALISQTCTGQQCNGAKFCGDGHQLLLRDATAKYDDNSQTNKGNPDAITWNDIGTDLVPTSAGQTVTARDPDGRFLHLFDPKTGKAGGRLALTGDSSRTAPSAVTSGTDADLIWIGARTYALATGASAFTWQAATSNVPSAGDQATVLVDAQLIAPTTDGAVRLDPAHGTVATRFAIPAPPAGSLVLALGNGLIVCGPDTTVYR